MAMGFVPPQEEVTLHQETLSSPKPSYPVEYEGVEVDVDKLIDLQKIPTEFLKSDKDVKTASIEKRSSNHITPLSQGFTEKESYIKRLENVTSTQAAIDIVKRDIIALESESEMIGQKQSNERRQIIYLGEQVCELRKKCQSMAKQLYIYEEMRCKGEIVFKSTGDVIPGISSMPDIVMSRPLNPYSKVKFGR